MMPACRIRVVPSARQHAVQDLPDEALVFLLGSRYCETDRLSETAWATVRAGADRMGLACRRSAISFTTILVFDYDVVHAHTAACCCVGQRCAKLPSR